MRKVFLSILLITVSIMSAQSQQEFDRIQDLIDKKDYAQSFALLDQLKSQNPNHAITSQMYAKLLLNLGNPNEALSNINRAIFLDKNNETNHLISGKIYRVLGEEASAIKSYETSIKINPRYFDAYIEYALISLQQHKLQTTERLRKLAKSFDNQNWKNDLLEARIALHYKQFDKAQQILLNAINAHPLEEQLIMDLAQVYFVQKKRQQTIILLQEANARFGDSANRNIMIGDIFFSNKDYVQALKYFLLAQSQIPSHAFSDKSLLAWKLFNLHTLNRNFSDAQTQIREALQLNMSNQLYISAYFQHLMNLELPSSALRNNFSKHLYKLAMQERTKGLGLSYVMLLQKAGKLDPLNTEVKDRLLEYSRITRNEHEINKILQEIANIKTSDIKIQQTIQLRNHLQQTKRLSQNPQRFYQLQNKVFIQPSFDLFSEIVGSEITNTELFFPNVSSSVEYQTTFSQASKTIFNGNTNFNIVTDIKFDFQGNMNITIYDKAGIPLKNFTIFIRDNNFSTKISEYIKEVSELFPYIGYVNKRFPNKELEISLGSNQKIKKDQKLIVFQNQVQIPVTVVSVKQDSAIVRMDSEPNTFNSLVNMYVAPIEFFPEHVQDQNTKPFDLARVLFSTSEQISF